MPCGTGAILQGLRGRTMTRNGKLGSLLLILFLALGSTTLFAAERSPLVTADQKALDALATRLYQNVPFPVLKAEARAAYLQAHGGNLSNEAASRLDAALNELTFSAIQKAVNSDPNFPRVYWLNTAPHAWGELNVPGGRYAFDNPDCIYRTIPIDSAGQYVIYGKRHPGSPSDISFLLFDKRNSRQIVGALEGRDIAVRADGSYVITVDSRPANGRRNHLRTTPDARMVFIRNNLGNWNTELPDNLSVKRVDALSSWVVPKTSSDIAADVWASLEESVFSTGAGTLGSKTYVNPVNTLPAPVLVSGLPSQSLSAGHFRLERDEALLVTVNSGGAGYFVLPVTDPWGVTVDPVNHQSSLNNKQAQPNADGSYTFVISPRDPGVYNWLDTAGLNEGTLLARWQNLPAKRAPGGWPAISAQLVRLKDLPTLLPVGTRYVSATEREALLKARREGFQRRLSR